MNKWKLVTGIILFGSLWGFSEVILGGILRDADLPAGAIMAGIFAIGLMLITRILYRQRGMQFGMALVAGTLRLFNPFAGCFICSAFAIMAEGLLFEFIWHKMSLDYRDIRTPSAQISMGIISGYLIYVGGFITTQILTPLISSAGFYLENLLLFIPQILSRGLLAALFGGITIPTILLIKSYDISLVRDKLYYPTAITVTLLCWLAVIASTLLA